MSARKKRGVAAVHPSEVIGEVIVSGRTHPIRRGLGATTDGLAGAEGYAVQKAWYDAQGLTEPARVRARREALSTSPDAGAVRRSTVATPSATQGPSAAELIRK